MFTPHCKDGVVDITLYLYTAVMMLHGNIIYDALYIFISSAPCDLGEVDRYD